MNRRGFLWAVGAAGLWLLLPASAAAEPIKEKQTREKIRTAIRGRRMLRFRYQGLAREFEPHALGTVKGGRVALLGWQISGQSRSGPPPGWRTFVLSEISNLRLFKKTFVPRTTYRAERANLREIEIDVNSP